MIVIIFIDFNGFSWVTSKTMTTFFRYGMPYETQFISIKFGWFNFLLAGEGTKLSNLGIYTANFFSLNVNKIDIFNNKDHDDLEKNFASCFGALKIIKDGWETEAIPKIKEKNIGKIGFFSKIFGHS